MLLTIRTTHRPATDLGYLLHKSPARTHEITLAHGRALVTFPEASEEACTAALYVELDPLALVQSARKRGEDEGLLGHYVNDRPYAASSLLAVALARAFDTALSGRSRERPELAETAIPLEATVFALPAGRGGELARALFSPLGWEVEVLSHPLDPAFPGWGEARFSTLTLRGTARLRDLLAHLYVLVPALDGEKHYWVGESEVEKLLDNGAGWLATHPERETIARRYLRRSPRMTRLALARLSEADGDPDPDARAEQAAEAEEKLEKTISLDEARRIAVLDALRELGARRVVDAGCGEGKLVARFLSDKHFAHVTGMDVSVMALERAADRLKLDRLSSAQRERVALFHGSLVYGDARLRGADAICAIEVVEHLDPWRLTAFERVLFADAAPAAVVLTTPNVEYNPRYGLPPGARRHADHRFEWTRAELSAWAEGVASRHGYAVELRGVGTPDAELGAPTQMALFRRAASASPGAEPAPPAPEAA